MAVKTVDEHAGEAPRGRLPKYLVKRQSPEDRAAGRMLQVKPYNEYIAKDPDWKGVHALPAEYVEQLAALNKQRAVAREEAKAYHQAFDQSVEKRKEEFDKRLEQQAQSLKVGPAEEAAQNEVNAEREPEAFVLSTATKEQLLAHAQEAYNVSLDRRMSADNLRLEVAKLAGVKPE